MGEVELCHLEEKFVLIKGIRIIDKHNLEIYIPLRCETHLANSIAIIQHISTPVPEAPNVEFSTPKLSSCLNAIYYHSRNLTDTALRIFLNHLLHAFQASVQIPVIKFAKSANKQELISVGTKRKSVVRDLHISGDLIVTASNKGIISSAIE